MTILLLLKVKYGFPVKALNSFISENDRELWKNFLDIFPCQYCISHGDGNIFILINDCVNLTQTQLHLKSLPLIAEEFLEIKVFHFSDLNQLGNILS